MVKKIVTLLLCVSTLFGCSCKKDDDSYPIFRLDDEYYTSSNKGLSEVDEYSDIQNLIDEDKSFALYVYTPGCSTCAAFKIVLDSYLEEQNLMFYSISNLNLMEVENPISKKIKYAPAIVLFDKGELITFLDTTNDAHTEYFKTKEKLGEWMNLYVDVSTPEK